MKPEELKLFYEPKERLRLTVGEERSYLRTRSGFPRRICC